MHKPRMLCTILLLALCWLVPTHAQTEVIVWHPSLEAQRAAFFADLVERFNASQTDVVLDLQIVPGGWSGIREKLITVAVGVSDPPAIIWTHTDSNWELESLGFFEPIPPAVIDELGLFDRFLGFKE